MAWRQFGYTPEKAQVLYEKHLGILDALAANNWRLRARRELLHAV